MIDAHYHMNMDKEDPVVDMLSEVRNNAFDGIVLLLNDERAMRMYCDSISIVKATSPIFIHPVVLLNPHNTGPFEEYSKILRENDIDFSVKIHPRISDVTIDDFEILKDLLSDCHYKNIVIDGFYYGSNLRNHISNELAIFLAKGFPHKSIVISHFGGFKLLETYTYTRDLANVFYDVSFTLNYFVNTSVWNDLLHCIKYNKHRVMFGSDHPSYDENESLGLLKDLLGELNDDELWEAVTDGNARRVYFEG